jgi:SAM-dependent methyltransferase
MTSFGRERNGSAAVGRRRPVIDPLVEWQYRFRRRYGGPYRSVHALTGRIMFARGQIDTTRIVHLDELGLAARDRVESCPSGWLYLRRALKGCRIARDDVFVDFGSGMGRAVYLAARGYPFGRVVGVEIAQQLNDIAGENIRRTRFKFRCQDVELVTCDVMAYVVPDDMTYAYFFNPFTGAIFQTVLDNIIASLDRRPRTLTICYANPVMEAMILDSGRFVKISESKGLRRDIRMQRIARYRNV